MTSTAFVTSTAFGAAIPAWVTPLGGRQAVRAATAAPWEVLDRPWVAAHASTRDDQAGEKNGIDHRQCGRLRSERQPATQERQAGQQLHDEVAR